MTIVSFSPWAPLAGGALIGLAATFLLMFNGRIFGITGIVSGIITPKKGDLLWRVLLVFSLGLGAFIAHQLFGTKDIVETRGTIFLIVGGLAVGLGARLGSGCTSGHGVCGISRFSMRSIVATCTFMLAGAITVFILRVLGV